MPTNSLVLPSHDEPFVRGASTLVGGPVGRHARLNLRGGGWTPLRVLLLLTLLTFTLGWAQKAPCRDGSFGEKNFYAYSRLCYTDVYALYFAEGLNEGKVPYRDHAVEYPVMIGGVMQAAAMGADAVDAVFGVANKAKAFFDVTALILLLCALAVVTTSQKLAGRRRPWDAAMVAVAPALVIHGTTNWDLVAVALAGLGLLAWAREKPWLAGVMWGVATATKLYPALFFAPLLVLCLRRKRFRDWLVASSAGFASWLALNGLVWTFAGSFTFGASDEPRNAVLRFFVGNRERVADWDSLWYVFEKFMQNASDNTGWRIDVDVLNWLVAGAVIAAIAAVCVLCARAPRPPRIGQVLFLVVAAFLLTNKVNSPQFTVWLLPLAVLARPRWGAFLVWQLTEIFVLFTRFYMFIHVSEAPKGLPDEWFLGAVLLRDAALVFLIVMVIREMWSPSLDVVRRDGVEDDPAGGVLVTHLAPA